MGSGVNIAARLESNCKPGEVLVSKIVKDQCEQNFNMSREHVMRAHPIDIWSNAMYQFV